MQEDDGVPLVAIAIIMLALVVICAVLEFFNG